MTWFSEKLTHLYGVFTKCGNSPFESYIFKWMCVGDEYNRVHCPSVSLLLLELLHDSSEVAVGKDVLGAIILELYHIFYFREAVPRAVFTRVVFSLTWTLFNSRSLSYCKFGGIQVWSWAKVSCGSFCAS